MPRVATEGWIRLVGLPNRLAKWLAIPTGPYAGPKEVVAMTRYEEQVAAAIRRLGTPRPNHVAALMRSLNRRVDDDAVRVESASSFGGQAADDSQVA